MTDGAETIKELKAAILAIEWEITDEAMDNLAQAVHALQGKWAGKKPLLVCLQVIGTLGQYIKKARERAHQDAIKLLHSVFSTLEKVVVSPEVTETEKVALVRAEVAKYNALKEELSRPRREKPPEPPPQQEKSAAAVEDLTGGGGSTMRTLMDQKEDSAVEGAFTTLFQGMVGEERQAPAPAAMPPMPSAGQGPDAKEIRLDRVDDEIFPEADSLLDDFFSDEGLGGPPVEAVAAQPVHEAGEEAVEVDIGQISPEKKEEPLDLKIGKTTAPEAEEEEVRAEGLGTVIGRLNQEVSGSGLDDLAGEIARLRKDYPDHSSMHLFLQYIGAMGRHLQRSPDVMQLESCRLLQKNYDRLNHALFTMKPQKTLLAAHLEATEDFIVWNEAVAAALLETRQPQVAAEPDAKAVEEQGELSAAMEAAVKDIVRQEVDRLRHELVQMMEKG